MLYKQNKTKRINIRVDPELWDEFKNTKPKDKYADIDPRKNYTRWVESQMKNYIKQNS